MTKRVSPEDALRKALTADRKAKKPAKATRAKKRG
jgi:hypothetical protein